MKSHHVTRLNSFNTVMMLCFSLCLPAWEAQTDRPSGLWVCDFRAWTWAQRRILFKISCYSQTSTSPWVLHSLSLCASVCLCVSVAFMHLRPVMMGLFLTFWKCSKKVYFERCWMAVCMRAYVLNTPALGLSDHILFHTGLYMTQI